MFLHLVLLISEIMAIPSVKMFSITVVTCPSTKLLYPVAATMLYSYILTFLGVVFIKFANHHKQPRGDNNLNKTIKKACVNKMICIKVSKFFPSWKYSPTNLHVKKCEKYIVTCP